MSSAHQQPDVQPNRDLLEVARDAAAAGDFAGMMNAILDSHFVDGLYRYLQKDWSQFDDGDAAELVGEALDAFYERAKSGTKIWKPRSYLFLTLQKLAIDEHERRQRPAELNEVTDAEGSRRADEDKEILINTVPRQDRVNAAIRLARQLVPGVGERVLQQVCEFYIDAVAKGLPCVEDETLADALGLSVDTARRLKNRALQRLRREARRFGIRITDVFGADIFKERAEVVREINGSEGDDHE
jgi:DNA-directed RNA polymerase specialized sigma24 family protein